MVHIVHRFDTGGLENGLVNLINHMPGSAYRHAVVALTEVTEFKQRVQREDVPFIALHKGPGQGFRLYPRLWRLLRELRPTIVHTRNLGPLEMQVAAAAARVPVAIHGEHGRELDDLDGRNRHLQRLRRVYSPFVTRYVALSQDLQRYLVERVGIQPDRIRQIYNGVDEQRFHRARGRQGRQIEGCPFTSGDGSSTGSAKSPWLVGTVGRMQGVKDQTLLATAFVRALSLQPALKARLRLVMVGEGPLRAASMAILQAGGVAELAWLPGERSDVADVMRGLDCFVLPSLAEGISNTILEAMATGLPVIATAVGGNAELVAEGRTGLLVPAGDAEALAQALCSLASNPERAKGMGKSGRSAVEQHFSLAAMVRAYTELYDRECAARPRRRAPA